MKQKVRSVGKQKQVFNLHVYQPTTAKIALLEQLNLSYQYLTQSDITVISNIIKTALRPTTKDHYD